MRFTILLLVALSLSTSILLLPMLPHHNPRPPPPNPFASASSAWIPPTSLRSPRSSMIPRPTGDLPAFAWSRPFPAAVRISSRAETRVEEYTKAVAEMGVEIVDSIPALLEKVDVVLLESVDGRPHLDRRPVFAAGKPVFIDKPLAGSLADAIAIAELAKKSKMPVVSSSSLRFGPGIAAMRNDPQARRHLGCDAWSPCTLEQTRPRSLLVRHSRRRNALHRHGPRLRKRDRRSTDDTTSSPAYGKTAASGRSAACARKTRLRRDRLRHQGHRPLRHSTAISRCSSKSRSSSRPQAPGRTEETLEIFAFMEAADESKRQGGGR